MATPLLEPEGHQHSETNQPASSTASTHASSTPPPQDLGDKKLSLFRMLLRDKFATLATVVLLFVGFVAVFGPILVGDLATRQDLLAANKPPFSLADGWGYVLGSDSLGRSMLGRLVIATRTTI